MLLLCKIATKRAIFIVYNIVGLSAIAMHDNCKLHISEAKARTYVCICIYHFRDRARGEGN